MEARLEEEAKYAATLLAVPPSVSCITTSLISLGFRQPESWAALGPLWTGLRCFTSCSFTGGLPLLADGTNNSDNLNGPHQHSHDRPQKHPRVPVKASHRATNAHTDFAANAANAVAVTGVGRLKFVNTTAPTMRRRISLRNERNSNRSSRRVTWASSLTGHATVVGVRRSPIFVITSEPPHVFVRLTDDPRQTPIPMLVSPWSVLEKLNHTVSVIALCANSDVVNCSP